MANENPLPQPEDIPWQLMCVSNDMLDPNKCNKKFPMPWRSSIAVSAYEPKEEDLLNIAVFPNSASNWNVKDFPKIISMEPQTRELVQISTESGELLTASKSGINTSKSFTNTDTTKTGVSGGVKLGAEVSTNDDDSASLELNLAGTKEWGNTTEDSTQTTENASQERSEREATTTEIQQLYNMLSAYHLGTNRAVFFMLPRPHVLQPTNRRTFVQGVRSIEGVQEFFLVVSRPKDMEGICVEAKLDTGHFPEDVRINEPEEKFKESEIEFNIRRNANNGANNGEGLFNQQGEIVEFDETFIVPSGWFVDRRTSPNPPFPKGDSGHVGITEVDIGSNTQGAPFDYDYQATDTQVNVKGKIQGANFTGPGAIFNKKYIVYLRSILPIQSEINSSADIADLFITTRSLCCCFYSDSPCLIKGAVPPNPAPPVSDDTYTRITEQRKLTIPEDLLSEPIASKSLEPATKGLLRRLKGIMISSRNGRFSHFEDGITFLESDYFVSRILKRFPESVKNLKLSSIDELDDRVKRAYGTNGTVYDALSNRLEKFILKTKLDYRESVRQRKIIINQVKVDRT